jgi:effector-binding domain-containing protein
MEHAVSIVTTSATPTAVIRETTTWERYPTLWGELLGEVWAFVRGADVRAGRNVMLSEDDVPNVEVGVEVADAITAGGRVVASALPAGRAATTVHLGEPSRERLHAAHLAVVDWCEANGHARTGVRWEVYDHWRDDPAAFETNGSQMSPPRPPGAGLARSRRVPVNPELPSVLDHRIIRFDPAPVRLRRQ